MIILLFTIIFIFAFGTQKVHACSAVYIGKEVSTDRSTIIARSEDQVTGAYNKLFKVVARVENEEGRYLTDIQGFKYPLPKTTYGYTAIPDASGYGDGVYSGATTNDCGLSITATVSVAPKEAVKIVDPFVDTGLREAAITDLVASTCKTPREAINLLAEVINEYGSGEGNIIMLADKDEAWIVEIYSGHLWAAQKMPTDKVAMFGNQFMIETVDSADKENFMYHPDLFTTAEKNGWTVKIGDKVHLAATFSEDRDDYSNMRTWMGHKIMAPSSAGDYMRSEWYPLFYTPDKKISPLEVMDILRSRFEGTHLDASLPENKELRVIGTERQSQIHVIQIKDKYPREMGSLKWLALANSEHSVFLPSFAGISDTHGSYKVDGEKYNPQGAYWKYKRICSLAEQNREFFGKGVRKYWKSKEEELYKEMLEQEDVVVELYKKDRSEAERYITHMHMEISERFNGLADSLYEELLFFIMDRTGRTAETLGEAFEFGVAADTPTNN